MSPKAINGIQNWYSLRYARPAWPKEFVDLLSPLKDKLEEALQQLPDVEYDSDLRVAFTRLPNGRYRLAVFLVIDEAGYRILSYREAAHLVFNTFVAILRKCDGLEIHEDSGLKAGDAFSWQMMQATDLWNYAFLTPME